MKANSHALMRALCLGLLFSLISVCSSCSQPEDTVPLDDKIGQMIMVGFRGMEIQEQSPILQDIRSLHIGGVILFDYDVPKQSSERNIESPGQVKKLISDLQSASTTPLFIAIDQEGGRVMRLKPEFGFPRTVSAAYLGRLDKADSTRRYAGQQASLLDSLGFNVNFAPVVDLNTNPENPVIGKLERSYSADPDVVIRHAGIVIEEHLRHGVVPVLKHYPGHGSAWNDSHKGIADVTDTWDPVELEPYQQLIASDSVPALMTAHVFNARLDATYPATLSGHVISGLLRDSLDFDGVVFSDDMQMDAIRTQYGLETAILNGINAGLDVLTFANNSVFQEDIARRAVAIIQRLVVEGKISRERIDRSYKRIMRLKQHF